MKCKNCGHRIRSTHIHDMWKLRRNPSHPYTHSIHGDDGQCKVKGCECYMAKPEEDRYGD